jgi:Type II CAAX prenyl endopeptidase Rce1-like
LSFAVFAVAAFAEELAYRGLLLAGRTVLTRRPIVLLLVSAAMFGLVHVTDSPDATAVGIVSDALGGVMYGVAFFDRVTSGCRSESLQLELRVGISLQLPDERQHQLQRGDAGRLRHRAAVTQRRLRPGRKRHLPSFWLAVIGAVLLTAPTPRGQNTAVEVREP